MSRKNTGTSGLAKSTGPGGNPKMQSGAGPFPNTYYGNSKNIDCDRDVKSGGETRKGK